MEKGIWDWVLQLGRWALQHFFACAGDGDVGETIQMPDGRSLRRLAELHRREYGSVFGDLTVGRTVYGCREGQKIEHVPLDVRLQLPEGKFWYLLQDWDQFLVVEEPYAGVSSRLGRILGFTRSVDSLERMNRNGATWVAEFFDSLPTPAPDQDQEGEIVVGSADGKGVPMRKPIEQTPIEAHQSTRGPKPNTKKMALLGTVYTVDRFARTPEQVLASLFRDTKEPAKEERAERPKPQNKRLRASLARSEAGTTEPAAQETSGGWLRKSTRAIPQGPSPCAC